MKKFVPLKDIKFRDNTRYHEVIKLIEDQIATGDEDLKFAYNHAFTMPKKQKRLLILFLGKQVADKKLELLKKGSDENNQSSVNTSK